MREIIGFAKVYRVSKKKTDAFHSHISRELIAGICLFPCVQQHEVVNYCKSTVLFKFLQSKCILKAVHMSRASPAYRADLSHENL